MKFANRFLQVIGYENVITTSPVVAAVKDIIRYTRGFSPLTCH